VALLRGAGPALPAPSSRAGHADR